MCLRVVRACIYACMCGVRVHAYVRDMYVTCVHMCVPVHVCMHVWGWGVWYVYLGVFVWCVRAHVRSLTSPSGDLPE